MACALGGALRGMQLDVWMENSCLVGKLLWTFGPDDRMSSFPPPHASSMQHAVVSASIPYITAGHRKEETTVCSKEHRPQSLLKLVNGHCHALKN